MKYSAKLPDPPAQHTNTSVPQTTSQSWAEDRDLMMRAAKNEPEAQRLVLVRSLPLARFVARKFFTHPADVEDAVQTVLLEVLRSASRFRGECSLETWSTQIAGRVALRLARTQRRASPAEASGEPMVESVPPQSSTPRPLGEYLSELPEAQREALLLRYALDYSVNEIAEETAASRNTVKYRLKQGLSVLRELIDRDLTEEGSIG